MEIGIESIPPKQADMFTPRFEGNAPRTATEAVAIIRCIAECLLPTLACTRFAIKNVKIAHPTKRH